MINASIKPLAQWGLPLPGVFLCAGPCSAESEEQLRQTAAGLAGCTLSLFRAGIWKPRTRPGAFQGAGVEALKWLVRIREEFGFPVGAEVGTPHHVEAALRHGLDLVWIGARTTPDPFAVQDIADALRGVDVPVLVKNPVSPDLEMWLGALERIHNAGIRRLGAIHRGFSTGNDSRYRNTPLWRIPIELRLRLPALPLICDPSHMCGRADTVFPTAQEAMDLLYDGLMVEVHHNPPEAWSDAAQQLTPAAFRDMLARLVFRSESGAGASYENEMRQLRLAVDEIDDDLVDVLARRMGVVRAMGDLKRRHQVSTLQPTRFKEILASRIAAAQGRGLGEAFISQVYQMIHEEAIRVQEEPVFHDTDAPGAGAAAAPAE
ncbi:MAG: bifunctional 3-deoxy-7-phosphoheptulonate synthase/chorismate mutase type II [Planctomycetes bacterium]|nr:bifunctional 3-deoxy-7-phosphoheptulonate synthase/chorismate mutase type II [Planctomycetota bacterium]